MTREHSHLGGRTTRRRPTRVLRTAVSTTLAVAALLGLPAAASSDGLDAVRDLEVDLDETGAALVRELP